MIRPTATVAAWLGGPPALAIVFLTAIGILRPWVGIACLIGCAVWSLGAGWVLARDIRGFGENIVSVTPGGPRLMTAGLTDLATATRHAIDAERRKQQTLATGADSSRILLDRLPDSLFELRGSSDARYIVWRNPAAIQAHGTEESALLRHPVLRAAFNEAEDSGQPVRASLTLTAPIPRDLDALVIHAGAGSQPASLYLLIADRTQERRIERMRADFVANASHELRTPLTSLIGFIETLRGPALGDAEATPRFLTIMAEQADRMQRIIADLLSLSRIEMTEHQPPAETVAIGPLLHQVAGFMEPILHEAGATLDLDIPFTLPQIRGDSSQLTQVFVNLIENAAKYGTTRDSGAPGTDSIRVGVTVTPDTRFSQPGLVVAITDEGPGISQEYLPRLTERFYRVDKGRARTIGGTGLGLAIVKHVVSRHRGRLVIESAVGIGTTCLVWLPLAPEPARGLQDGQMSVARKG
ncbi:MAG TPA: ATP-binding protein [Acidiphilium sp.]